MANCEVCLDEVVYSPEGHLWLRSHTHTHEIINLDLVPCLGASVLDVVQHRPTQFFLYVRFGSFLVRLPFITCRCSRTASSLVCDQS